MKVIENQIFSKERDFYGSENVKLINCSFKGFPFRGVETSSCIFIKCNGEITDDIECSNTLGLSKYNEIILKTKLNNREQAAKLIEELQ